MEEAQSVTERERIKYKYLNAIISFKHSVCIVIGTTYFVMNNDWVQNHEATNFQWILTMYDITYVIVDLLYILLKMEFDLAMIVHHLIVIMHDLYVIVYYQYGNEFMWIAFIGEISAPFYNLKQILPFIASENTVLINN